MLVKTESGSVYEINEAKKLVKRLSGEGKPTYRVGDDWKHYEDVKVTVGKQMIIIWNIGPDDGSGAEKIGDIPADSPRLRTTVTSEVVEIIK